MFLALQTVPAFLWSGVRAQDPVRCSQGRAPLMTISPGNPSWCYVPVVRTKAFFCVEMTSSKVRQCEKEAILPCCFIFCRWLRTCASTFMFILTLSPKHIRRFTQQGMGIWENASNTTTLARHLEGKSVNCVRVWH